MTMTIRTSTHTCSLPLRSMVGMAQSAVSHQLRVLREMKFVVGERRGRQVLYRLHDEHVASLLDEAVFHMQHLDLGTVAQRRAAS